MDDQPQLTVNEQPVADAYAEAGVWPDDPDERRILAYLIESGQVQETVTAEGIDLRTGNPAELEQPTGDDGTPEAPADSGEQPPAGEQQEGNGADSTGTS